MKPSTQRRFLRKAAENKLLALAQRTLDGIDWDALFVKVRDRLNAKNKFGPRWT